MTTIANQYRRPAVRTLGVLAAVGTGGALACETEINGLLGARTTPLQAAVFSNSLSLLAVFAVSPFIPGIGEACRKMFRSLRAGRLNPACLFGGVAGGFMVLTQATTTAPLGVALFTLAAVSGQTIASALIDHIGIGPGGARLLTRQRLVGMAAAILAVAVPAANSVGTTSILVLLPIAAGAGVALQLALNGRVDESAEHPFPSTFLSFLLGVLLLGSISILYWSRSGSPVQWADSPALYAGGLFGVLFVLSSVLVVRHFGVFLATIGIVSGQVLASLAITVAKHGASSMAWSHLVAIPLMLFSVIAVSSRQPRENAPAGFTAVGRTGS